MPRELIFQNRQQRSRNHGTGNERIGAVGRITRKLKKALIPALHLGGQIGTNAHNVLLNALYFILEAIDILPKAINIALATIKPIKDLLLEAAGLVLKAKHLLLKVLFSHGSVYSCCLSSSLTAQFGCAAARQNAL